MKRIEDWKQKRFNRNKKGRIIGSPMEAIIGNAYEPVIRQHTAGSLLDVGCGDVPYYAWYKDNVSDITCIDWPDSNLSIEHLDHIVDLNEPLTEFRNETYDTVLCTDVLEHVKKPGQLFSEMTRVLKPGGKLIVTVPYLYWIHADPWDYYRYSHFKLRDYCEENALKIELLEAYGGLPEVLFDLVYKGYDYYNLPAKNMFLACWKSLGRFLARRGFVQRLSMRSRPTFPMGYILVASK
ncbi:MAG: class I SAM-dependent methyltransferase [Bacteroidetes bacterium]|nr:class I SAM-dependent methyltransferase [Bacteroidota bacterium]